MNTLDRYLFKKFIPLLFGGLTLFVMLLELIDIFSKIWRYFENNAPILEIAKISLLYLPKCISFALPIALIFALAYTMGELSANNELIVIFASGISLARLARPFIIFGIALSVFSFVFEDLVVLQTLYAKEQLSARLTDQELRVQQSDIIVKADSGRRVYSVGYINLNEKTISRVTVVDRDDQGNFLFMLKSTKGRWNGQFWEFENPHCFLWREGQLANTDLDDFSSYREIPESFVRSAKEVEQLSARQAKAFIAELRSSGARYQPALADYYRRFAFSATPLVVIALSMSMGGRFRKNVLLLSLLSSLMSAVLYYVIQMVSMMLAKLAYIPAVVGAWFPSAFFILLAFILLTRVRT